MDLQPGSFGNTGCFDIHLSIHGLVQMHSSY